MQKSWNQSEDPKIFFEKIYTLHLHKVQFFAYNFLHDYELAKSIAHDTFVSIWENWDSIDFERDPLPYILTLTKNKCLNILRKNKVEQKFQNFSKYAYDKESLNYLALKDSSATKLYSKEIESILSHSMSKMPEKIKQTFCMSRFDNMKYEEIANLLGISVKTVESRMMSALKILRVNFKDYLPHFIGFIFLIL